MSFAATSLRISAGIIVWILHFVAIYGFTALACARGAPQPVPWVIAGATIAGIAACLVIVAKEFARRERFESWLAAGVAAFALLAILWEALTVFMVPICE